MKLKRRDSRGMTALAVALSCAAAAAQQPAVTIEGGADASGQNYEWFVTNNSKSEIVAVEFPHYRATLFFAPEGWTKPECTHLTNVGVPDKPGVCRATAGSVGSAIGATDSASFRMQCAPRSSVPGRATVMVRFADDSVVAVPGVSVPQKEPIVERYLPAIGLAVIAGAFLAFRALSRRNRATEDAA